MRCPAIGPALAVTSYLNRTMNRSPCGHGPSARALWTSWFLSHQSFLPLIASRPSIRAGMDGLSPIASMLTMLGLYSASTASMFLPSRHRATSRFPTVNVSFIKLLRDYTSVLGSWTRNDVGVQFARPDL